MPEEQRTRDHGREGALPPHECAEGSGEGSSSLHSFQGQRITDPRVFVENAPCGFIVLDLRGKILLSNSAFRHMVGHTELSLQESSFQDFLSRGGKIFYETQFVPTLILRSSLSVIAFELAPAEGE